MKPFILKAIIVFGISLLLYTVVGSVFNTKKYYSLSLRGPKREITKKIYEKYENEIDMKKEIAFNDFYATIAGTGFFAIGLIFIAYGELKKKTINTSVAQSISNTSKGKTFSKSFKEKAEERGYKVVDTPKNEGKTQIHFRK